MKKYIFNSEEFVSMMNALLDRFMEYEFKWGYEEPRARTEAIMDILALMEKQSEGNTQN